MIIGITGAICAGKRAFAEYLAKKYSFDLIDMLDLFRKELRKQGLTIEKECSPIKGSRRKD
jgi:dephospho-CoA kinase